MALYTNIYTALKALDAGNARAMVAAAAQAMQWDAAHLAVLCGLIGASPTEVAGIVAAARASKEAGSPWFNQS